MVSIFVLFSVIEKVAAWSSIGGLCISIATLIIAGSVNHAIRKVNKGTLIRQKLQEDLNCLSNYNSMLFELISNQSEDRIKICNLLSKIVSQVKSINRYVPKEYVRMGRKLTRKISRQCRCYKGNDALWNIYRDSVGFVDGLSNYSREKDFIS